MSESPPTQHPHLHAAGGALLLTGVIIATALLVALRLENRHLAALLPESLVLKNQGLVIQKAAFAQPDVLPLYGSSELVKPIPDKASLFFRRRPSDFSISPVGKGGTASMIIMEKLAAVGPALSGRKVVVSLSPSWFFCWHGGMHTYEGNFSALLAREFIFNDGLSPEFRRDASRQMLKYPATLEERPLLRFAIERLAADTPQDRFLYRCVQPLGWVQNGIGRVEDHLTVGLFIAEHLRKLKPPPPRETALDWDRLKDRWARRSNDFRPRPDNGDVKTFLSFGKVDDRVAEGIDQAMEWDELELMLRLFKERGARPLLLSLPMNGVFFDSLGIKSEIRQHYYGHLRAMAQRYQVPEFDFEEHEEDSKFFADTYDHPSAKGWIYFNEVIDAFFHDRLQYQPHRSRAAEDATSMSGTDARCVRKPHRVQPWP